MKANELIKALQEMPQDAEVWHLWDGEARTQINHVWLSMDGRIITADSGMVCYTGSTRPCTAPTSEEDLFWETPDLPRA